jgi:hypothetical protein
VSTILQFERGHGLQSQRYRENRMNTKVNRGDPEIGILEQVQNLSRMQTSFNKTPAIPKGEDNTIKHRKYLIKHMCET